MVVYEVFDDSCHGDRGYYCRNLKEAKATWASVKRGYLKRIVIPAPINKDVIIALLNHEGFAIEHEEMDRKW